MRLSPATTHFTRQLAANGCSVHTQKAYARDLAVFARWLGQNVQLSAIRPDDLARFLISDAVVCTPDGQPRKPITINRTKSALRSFFQFCEESGWIRENPARLIRSAPAAAKERSTLTEDEIRGLRAVLAENSGVDETRKRYRPILLSHCRTWHYEAMPLSDSDLRPFVIFYLVQSSSVSFALFCPTPVKSTSNPTTRLFGHVLLIDVHTPCLILDGDDLFRCRPLPTHQTPLCLIPQALT